MYKPAELRFLAHSFKWYLCFICVSHSKNFFKTPRPFCPTESPFMINNNIKTILKVNLIKTSWRNSFESCVPPSPPQPQRARSHGCPSLWSSREELSVLQPVCSADKGVSSSLPPGWECVYRPLTPGVQAAGQEAEAGPLGMKTSKQILIQLEKDTIVLWIPSLAGRSQHLASFLGDCCGIDLDLKLIDMHT